MEGRRRLPREGIASLASEARGRTVHSRHGLTGSSTVARKSGERELDDAGSEARSPCPEGWLTLQKLRSSRRSSSEVAASQGRDARTGDGRDGVEDASGQTETGTVSRGSVEAT